MGNKTISVETVSVKKSSIQNHLTRKGVSVLTGLSISLLTFSSVDALNIGQARTQSYLGQPLSIFVPVSDPGQTLNLNQLVVAKPSSDQLKSLKVSGVNNDLSYQVVSNGAEKGILITSQVAFNEPYIDLGVKVDYQGVSQLSKLTVLIDLEPPVGAFASQDAPAVTGSQTFGTPLNDNYNNVEEASAVPTSEVQNTQSTSSPITTVTYNSEIMGPYDWAQKERIPEKFGPVLEGQSLWRVARRINESMGVSIDQMMWALYRANPQAFIGNNVSTLQAGSILSIPNESFVREVTELGAVRLLNSDGIAQKDEVITNKKELNSVSETSSEPIAVDNGQIEPISSSTKNEVVIATDPSVSNDVQLGSEIKSINEASALEPINPSINDTANQADSVVSLSQLDAIDDLKNEVSYLNQLVEDQGKRIQVLEQRLAIAESNTSPIIAAETAVSEAINEATTPVENIVADTTNSIAVENTATNSIAQNAAKINDSSFKVWSLGALALFLLGFAYYARHKVMPVVLKIFGDRYEYDEEEPLLNAITKKRKPLRPLHEGQTNTVDNESEQGVASSKKEDQDDFEDYSFFIDNQELMDVEELSFPDRIKQLIDSGDFDEAKKTVNFASEANVNEHDINVYLLKIFAAESDRTSFDKLFDKIHANIDQYDADAQLMIAEIQSEMAIGKVINFNNEKMAG